MTRRLLYKLASMSEDERLICIFGLRSDSINQSRKYDLLVVSTTSPKVFVELKNVQSYHSRWPGICLSACGLFQGMRELIECIPLDTRAGELLPAAPEVRHRRES